MWQLTSMAIRFVVQLVVIAILARRILPSAFGLIALANMALVFTEMFAEAGIGPAIIQKKDLRQEHIRAGFTLAVILGTFFVVILWMAAPLLAVLFKSETLEDIIRWLSLSVLVIKFGMISRSLIEREIRFDKLMWTDAGSYVFGYAPVGIAMAIMGYGVWSIVAAKLVQCCLQSIVLFAWQPHSVKPVFSTRAYKEIGIYGGGLTLARLFDNTASQGDVFIIGRFCSVTLLGIYERASSIMAMPGQYLGYLLDKILFPSMSQIQDQPKRLEGAYLKAINIVNVTLFPLSVLMFVVAPELITVLLGPRWTDAVIPLRILLVTLNLRICINLSDTLVRATGAVYSSAARKAVFAFLVIFGSWVGQRWGIAGVAIAVSLAVIINYSLMTQLSIKLINCSLNNYLGRLKDGYVVGGVLFLISFFCVSVLRLCTDSALLTLVITGVCSCLLSGIAVFLFFPGVLNSSVFELLPQLVDEKYRKHPFFCRLSEFRKNNL